MPVCFQTVTAGMGQPFIKVPVPVDANGMPEYSKCEFVVLTGTDYHLLGAGSGWSQLTNINIEQAQTLGLAIVGVWAIAYAFRLLIKAIDDYTQESSSS